MELILIILIAFFVALIFSMLGLGGAIIYTPLFFWLGVPLLSAIPMALMLNTITTFSASITYLRQHLVHTRIAIPVIITSIVGAIAGSYFAGLMDMDLIILILSIVLMFASIRMFFFNSMGLVVGTTEKKKALFGACAGLLIGIVSSLVGIGGGTFIVPLLLILGLKTKNATATSSFIITFMALAGFLGHLSMGHVQLDFELLISTGIAVFIGAQAGTKVIFRRTSSRVLNHMFGVVLLVVVIKLLYGLL